MRWKRFAKKGITTNETNDNLENDNILNREFGLIIIDKESKTSRETKNK